MTTTVMSPTLMTGTKMTGHGSLHTWRGGKWEVLICNSELWTVYLTIKRFHFGRCPIISCSGELGRMVGNRVAKHHLVSTVHQKGVKVGSRRTPEWYIRWQKSVWSLRGRPRLPELPPCWSGHSFLEGEMWGTAKEGLETEAREG